MEVKGCNWCCRSHDNDNMADVVQLNFIHTIWSIFNGLEVSFKPTVTISDAAYNLDIPYHGII